MGLVIKSLSREWREEAARETKKERLGVLEWGQEKILEQRLTDCENKDDDENING